MTDKKITYVFRDEPGASAYTVEAELGVDITDPDNATGFALATQSAELLDHFEAEDVVVVDRTANGSARRRSNGTQDLWRFCV